MNDHPKLFEIVQKVFNAGQKFAEDTLLADVNNTDLPAAYPVITPLIAEAVRYVDDQRLAGKLEVIAVAEAYRQHVKSEYGQGWEAAIDHIVSDGSLDIPVRPSSPFRSVEIQDGDIVK